LAWGIGKLVIKNSSAIDDDIPAYQSSDEQAN
jgi:hypothetical protein